MKFSRVYQRSYNNCASHLKAQFRSLNFRENGQMLSTLGDRNYKIKIAHYILDESGNVAAWSLTFGNPQDQFYPHLTTYFYTRAKYRRKGLGLRLARAASKYSKKLKVKMGYCEYDERSESFFSFCRKSRILTRSNSIPA